MNYRKKLIEVALPLEAISEESSRRKRKAPGGYPTTFHKWWAQRPIAACRAVIFASLVDDPDSDPTFRNATGKVDEERAGYRRAELFNLMEELIKWENSNNESILGRARAEIAASVASMKIFDTKEWSKDQIVCKEKAWAFVCRTAKSPNVNSLLAEYAPPVLDPFCGGGSIPLEAQRLGLRSLASDLNPVPVIITKGLTEIPFRFRDKPPANPESQATLSGEWTGARGLAADVRYYGEWLREEAVKRIGQHYPKVKVTRAMAKNRPDLEPYIGEELVVIAWLWARTVASPNPTAHGAHVPLVGSFWLSTKKGKESWVRPVVDRVHNMFHFEVGVGSPPHGFDPRRGTVVRTGGTCLLTDQPMSFEHIREEGKSGRMKTRLMAIAVEGRRGRLYLPPLPEHEREAELPRPDAVPETPIPEQALGFRVQLYGVDQHFKLFTNRQLTALTTLSDLAQLVRERVLFDLKDNAAFPTDDRPFEEAGGGRSAYADAISVYLAAALSRVVDYNSSFATWRPKDNAMRSTFSKQALPMVWDFAEANVFGNSSAGVSECVEVVAHALDFCTSVGFAEAVQLDATASIDRPGHPMTCTDPPYYSNIGYSDLSDCLYVWLRRTLVSRFPRLFATLLTPKGQELIASPYRHDGGMEAAKEFFEGGLRAAFTSIRKSSRPEYPTTVFYAFKQAETEDSDDDDESGSTASTGWETMLSAFNSAGFVITGTWPMRTEGDNRQVGIGTNALASSVVLVGKPRPVDAPLATRREFLTTLKRELPEALKHLQRGSIAPVDLAQAAIGPGMAVFTRYSKVMEADGSSMKVRQALALINQMLDDVLAEQEGEFDTDTRWALAWFEQFGMEEGAFGVAETLSKAKNAAVNGLQDAGIIKARSGKVRLLKRDEMNAEWNPATDERLTSWEVTQHLIRALDTGGETAAADLLRRLGGVGEVARDLAYRLFSICERKKWAEEAIAYNSLVIAWPELSRLSRSAPVASPAKQTELF